jgi:hypothetical protein
MIEKDIADVRSEKVEDLVEKFEQLRRDTERRLNGPRPPRPSARALRHRRENDAARHKKRLRKQSRRRTR